MADFTTCATNNISFETLLAALFAKTATPAYGLRINLSLVDTLNPIACTTHDDFVQLFRQSLYLCDDGLPCLRVLTYDAEYCPGGVDADTLSPAKECASDMSLDLIMRKSFAYDANGDVGFVVLICDGTDIFDGPR